jgi:hypothetical protein
MSDAAARYAAAAAEEAHEEGTSNGNNRSLHDMGALNAEVGTDGQCSPRHRMRHVI